MKINLSTFHDKELANFLTGQAKVLGLDPNAITKTDAKSLVDANQDGKIDNRDLTKIRERSQKYNAGNSVKVPIPNQRLFEKAKTTILNCCINYKEVFGSKLRPDDEAKLTYYHDAKGQETSLEIKFHTHLYQSKEIPYQNTIIVRPSKSPDSPAKSQWVQFDLYPTEDSLDKETPVASYRISMEQIVELDPFLAIPMFHPSNVRVATSGRYQGVTNSSNHYFEYLMAAPRNGSNKENPVVEALRQLFQGEGPLSKFKVSVESPTQKPAALPVASK